jgi:hypothetical protein
MSNKEWFHLAGWVSILLAFLSMAIVVATPDPRPNLNSGLDFCYGYSLSYIGTASLSRLISLPYEASSEDVSRWRQSLTGWMDRATFLVGAVVLGYYLCMYLRHSLGFSDASLVLASGVLAGNLGWSEFGHRAFSDFIKNHEQRVEAASQSSSECDHQ